MGKALILNYAMSLVGLPYIWGGDSPLEGFDCSGLVLELLKAEGEFEPWDDTTSAGLYIYLKSKGWKRTGNTEPGCIAFYGRSVNKITHVAYCVGDDLVVEAAGGNHTTITPEVAMEQDAYVRVRPIKYRKDLVAILVKSDNVFPFNLGTKK